MPTIIVYTVQELESRGLIRNPNMWIGNGWFYCVVCSEYTYHFAMSHRNDSDCFEICKQCKSYSGHRRVE